ncbi:MAG: YceI family protein, partial [Candidatus Hydrogenedentes bacterium]|nr:YceI family protein [Candidatus Hydrogenedentota bacterium]
MRKILYMLVLVAALGLSFNLGCNRTPPEEATKVTATEAQPVEGEATPTETPAATTETAAPAEPEVPSTVLTIGPNMDSFLTFVGYGGILGQMEGGFANFNGQITLKGDDLSQARVKVVVDMPSVYSESNKLTKVLKEENFFQVDKFPTSTFISTKIEKSADGYNVTGNLDMHGQVRSITFPVKMEMDGDNLKASAEFTIDRTQWDIVYNDWGGSTIKNECLISFEILAEPATADAATTAIEDVAPAEAMTAPVEEPAAAAPAEEAAPAEPAPAEEAAPA